MTKVAEYYVDAGGEKDQMLFAGGPVRYRLRLEPAATRELLFLLASPGGGPAPDPERMLWTPETLLQAAADVWKDRWQERN